MKNFAKGLLFGALVGTASGLFLAPQKGKESRQKIKDELNDWTKTTSDFSRNKQSVQTSLNNLKERTATSLPPFIDETKQRVEDFKFQATPRIQQIKEQLTKIKQELPNK